LQECIELRNWKIDSHIVPLVSINCLTYNHSKYIRDAIEGFLMQKTNFPVEILIHDDASTDGTTEIIKEYEKRYPNLIKPLYEEENQWVKGRRGSLVFNIPRAQGKYIAFCEGDDYWTDPYKLQKQVDFLETHPDYGMVHTDDSNYDERTGITVFSHKKDYYPYPPSGKVFIELIKKNFISTLTVVCRTDILRLAYLNMEKFLPDKLYRDYSLWLEISLRTKIKYLDMVTATYRIHEGSITRNLDKQKRAQFVRSQLDIIIAFYNKYLKGTIEINKYINIYIDDNIKFISKNRLLFKDLRHYIVNYRPSSFRNYLYRLFFLVGINPNILSNIYNKMKFTIYK
jgi:glycosyltransferase involved in cell wall biosynthesis